MYAPIQLLNRRFLKFLFPGSVLMTLGWTLVFGSMTSTHGSGIRIPARASIAQPSVEPLNGEEISMTYFKRRTEALEERTAELVEVENLEDWKQTQRQLRLQLQDMLGLNPWPEKGDLKPVITGTIEKEDYIIEKLHFQSSPGLYVTANLYKPKEQSQPAPAILYVCGHSHQIQGDISYGNKTGYHHHGVWFARNGYVCLMVDTLQLGEIQGVHHGTYRYGRWDWNARGYTPAGIEAWNSIRAIDYLETRKEVDPGRIGITGRSGGGAYSWWTAALDERIQVAAPVAGITDLRNHVVDGVVSGHCDCMFMVNTYGWDYPLVAAMVAPRPLLILNSDKDSIFPLDGVVRTHSFVRSIYGLYGAESALGLTITEGPHQDTQELRIPAFHWFDRHLKKDEQLIETAAAKTLDRRDLRVFGDELPADELNTRIDDLFIPEIEIPVPAGLSEWTRMRGAIQQGLKDLSLGSWSWGRDLWNMTKPDLRRLVWVSGEESPDGVTCTASVLEFETEPGYPLRLVYIELAGNQNLEPETQTSMLEVTGEGDWNRVLAGLKFGLGDQFSKLEKSLQGLGDLPNANSAAWEELVKTGGKRWILAPRGVGPSAWADNPRDLVQVRRRFQLLGETQDGMRVWDVIQALRAIGQTQIQVQASGAMGGLVLAASAVAEFLPDQNFIGEFQWSDPAPLFGAAEPVLLNRKKVAQWPQILAIGLEKHPVTLSLTKNQMDQLGSGTLNWVLDWSNHTGFPISKLKIQSLEANESAKKSID